MKFINSHIPIASYPVFTEMRECYFESIARRGIIAVVAVTLVMAGIACEVYAQTGTVSGKVTDEQTGEPLPGAKLDIGATGQTVKTDKDGRYVLSRVPAGAQTISVRHFGYVPRDVSVMVASGERLEQLIALQGDFFEGDKIFVRAAQREQARVLNSQNTSDNFKTVITSEQMKRFGDYTIKDAMIRAPGVQFSSQRELNLRGVGLQGYYVTVDGQRMATSGMRDRSVDLDMISADLIQDLEIIKVLTPDMDADAVSGVVNLTTYSPLGAERTLDVHLGGGGSTAYFNFTGPGGRAALRYAESVTEELSLSLNLNYQLVHRSRESLDVEYGVADFGEGPVDVIERVAPGLQNDSRNLFGGGINMFYQPSVRSTFYLRGLASIDVRQVEQHIDNYIANSDWINPQSTGLIGDIGMYRQDANRGDINSQQYMLQSGARHLFDAYNLEYSLGWSQSRVDRRDYVFPFGRDDFNYSIDMNDRTRPVMLAEHAGRAVLGDGTFERRLINSKDFEESIIGQVENNYSGRVNVEIPFTWASFKFGSSTRLRNKVGEYDETNYTYIRYYSMYRFKMMEQRRVDVMDQYLLAWLVDTDGAKNFLNVNRPVFTKDEDLRRLRSDIWNYEVSENIYAGYGMATLGLERFTFFGGARIEYTDARYNGKSVLFDESGTFDSSVDTSVDDNYMHIFPNAQLVFDLDDFTNIRLGYSKSIRRSNFHSLSPFELVNRQDSTLFRGNPALEPVISDNYDFSVDHYLFNIGIMSLGLFYKDMSNLVVLEQRTNDVLQGDIAGFDPAFNEDVTVIPVRQSEFRNRDKATLYGLELSWQQRLTFLPGFWNNFGIFANYMWSDSIYDYTDREVDVALPYQSPHVVNAAIDYTQGRFYAQVSYHWTAEFLSILEQTPDLAPSVSRSEEVFLDEYQDGWTDLSVSFRFRLSENFRFWADVSNLLGNEQVQYFHTRDYYPTNMNMRGGVGLIMGLRYSY